MEFIGLFLLFLFFSEIVLPLLRDLTILLAQLLGLCALKLLELAAAFIAWLALRLWRIAIWLLRHSARGAGLAFVFLFYLADEWLRGPREDEAAQEDSAGGEYAEQEHQPPAQRDPYAAALARLGLAPGFTQEDLRRAYRQAMKWAHPDAGGSVTLAQIINADRDLIARHHGWK